MNDKYIKNFYNEVSHSLEGEYKIILEPKKRILEEWIEYDQVNWELDDKIKKIVKKLLDDTIHSFEEKVLILYEFICLNYIYDDNVLYFFRRDTTDINNIKYIAVDWYGRIISEKWIENRKHHNRRVCYEFARFYAKAINILLNNNDELEAFMLGDTENLHYVVGLTGKDYSIVLDLDDFNSVKDLTRIKLGLSIKGIKILRDDFKKFTKTLDNFNTDKLDELTEVESAKQSLKNKNIIEYFNKIIDILNSNNIDSQGFCEYMRSIIESEGIEIEKIWKEVKSATEKRYSRCLIFNYDHVTYLLDSIDKTLKVIIKENLDKKLFVFNPEENEYPYFGG